jgi:hypothetical protein
VRRFARRGIASQSVSQSPLLPQLAKFAAIAVQSARSLSARNRRESLHQSLCNRRGIAAIAFAVGIGIAFAINFAINGRFTQSFYRSALESLRNRFSIAAIAAETLRNRFAIGAESLPSLFYAIGVESFAIGFSIAVQLRRGSRFTNRFAIGAEFRNAAQSAWNRFAIALQSAWNPSRSLCRRF